MEGLTNDCDPEEPKGQNYRAISFLTAMSKIAERIAERLEEHTEELGIFPNKQCGFRG